VTSLTQQAPRTHSEARAAVLRALGPEPQTSEDIAQRVGFSGQAVRWALNRLLALDAVYGAYKVERNVIPGRGSRWRYGWRLTVEAEVAAATSREGTA